VLFKVKVARSINRKSMVPPEFRGVLDLKLKPAVKAGAFAASAWGGMILAWHGHWQ
jgi:hypothetical protein